MKFEKALVTIINLEGTDILTESTGIIDSPGCTTSGFIAGDMCGDQSQHDKFYNCNNNGHINHGGQ